MEVKVRASPPEHETNGDAAGEEVAGIWMWKKWKLGKGMVRFDRAAGTHSRGALGSSVVVGL